MNNTRTIARPYAKAAFDFALSQNQLDVWSNFLKIATEVVENSKVIDLIKNPQVSDKDVGQFVMDICGKEYQSQPIQNFVQLMSEKHRLDCVPEVSALYEELKLRHEQTLNVQVYTPYEIEKDQEQRLRTALEKRFSKKVLLTQILDATLLGGVLVRIGDIVIDSSVRGNLQRLKNHLNLKESVCQASQ